MTAADFVASQIEGCERGWDNCQSIGYKRDGDWIAGFVYHNWSPETGVIEMSAASTCRDWISRKRLKEIFEYPFSAVGCRMVVARTAESNARVRRIFRALGGREYVIPDLRADGEAEIIITLHARDWQRSKFSR